MYVLRDSDVKLGGGVSDRAGTLIGKALPRTGLVYLDLQGILVEFKE